MGECPVCRTSIRFHQQTCPVCETPVRRSDDHQTSFSRRLTALFPGPGHFFLGHIFKGSFAFFGSLLSIVLLFQGGGEVSSMVKRLSYWVLFWVPWVFFWLSNVKKIRRSFVSFSTVVKFFVVMLVLCNILGLIMNIYVISNFVRI